MASNAKKRKLSEPKKKNKCASTVTSLIKTAGLKLRNRFTEKTSSEIYEDVRLLKKITSWKLDHKWLVYKNNEMYCNFRREAGLKNKFKLKEGCTNFKSSALDDYLAVTGPQAHKLALVVPKLQKDQTAAEERALSEDRLKVIVRMQVVAWLAKEGIPLSKFETLLELLSKLKLNQY